jgi:hypothetical protein
VAAGWFTLAAAGPVKVPVQPQFTLGLWKDMSKRGWVPASM